MPGPTSKLSRQLANVLLELRSGKTRGKNPRDYTPDEIRAKEALRDNLRKQMRENATQRAIQRINDHTTSEADRIIAAQGQQINEATADSRAFFASVGGAGSSTDLRAERAILNFKIKEQDKKERAERKNGAAPTEGARSTVAAASSIQGTETETNKEDQEAATSSPKRRKCIPAADLVTVLPVLEPPEIQSQPEKHVHVHPRHEDFKCFQEWFTEHEPPRGIMKQDQQIQLNEGWLKLLMEPATPSQRQSGREKCLALARRDGVQIFTSLESEQAAAHLREHGFAVMCDVLSDAVWGSPHGCLVFRW